MSDAEWLRGLARKGGKGAVNNIDARALGRIADRIEALEADNAALREALILYDAYQAMPADRGGDTGPRGLAYKAFCDAKSAALATPSPGEKLLAVVRAARVLRTIDPKVVFRGHAEDYVKAEMPISVWHNFVQALDALEESDG